MARQSEGSRLYTRALISAEAMRKAAEAGLSFRISPFDGEGPEASQVFAREASVILDFISVKGRPDQEEQLLCKYRAADSRMGYCRRDGSDAFGGLHNFPHTDLEDVRGVPYLRTVDEVKVEGLEEKVEKEGLFDIDGNLLTGKRYDSISRYETDLLDDDVFLIREGSEYGLMLPDGSLVGGENGMQEGEVNLKKFAEKIYLHVKKDGKEKYITWAGQDAYGGWHTKIEEFSIGNEILGLATDEEGKVCPFSEENDMLYGGWHAKVSEYRVGNDVCGLATDEEGKLQLFSRANEQIYGTKPHVSLGNVLKIMQEDGTDEFVLEVYDEEGLMIKDRQGNSHYGHYHKDPEKKGSTIEVVDNEVLMRFLDEEKEDRVIRYWRFNPNEICDELAYGGEFEVELQAGDPKADPSIVAYGKEYKKELQPGEKGSTMPFLFNLGGQTATIKKVRKGKREGYFAKDPIESNYELFAGLHDWQFGYMEWKNDICIGFYDKGKGFCYFSLAGEKLCGGYHPKVRGTKMITVEEGAKRQHPEAFLEVIEPVPFFSRRRFFGGRLRTPPTYYSLKGERFTSLKEIQERYAGDARLEDVRKTESVAGMRAITDEEASEIIAAERAKDPFIIELEEREMERKRREAEETQKRAEEPGPEEAEEGT